MKIVVCIKQSANGEINPFDASAYEAALSLKNSEVIILSMGPEKTKFFLENLTRLGAKKAVLLCDRAFAGADTLATSYALSLAIKMLNPDLVFCGRQSVDGDTGQVGPSLAVRLGFNLVTNIMLLKKTDNELFYTDRIGNKGKITDSSVLTFEKSLNLRLPSIRSKKSPVEILGASDINADISYCGLKGSPTRVLKTFENDYDRRNCKFIKPEELITAVKEGIKKGGQKFKLTESKKKLKNICCIGENPIAFAKSVGENINIIDFGDPKEIAKKILCLKPDAVLWGNDMRSKSIAPQVTAFLNTGLCADCTSLKTDGEILYMYRPACSGNIIAKIKCETNPPMASVCTAEKEKKKIIIGIGYGAREFISDIIDFAEKINAGIAATRKTVDSDFLPYDLQVGLTGKTVNPDVYIAIGISGAIHHIAGIRHSGTIIAINPDKDAPIFKYADYGIIDTVSSIKTVQNIFCFS